MAADAAVFAVDRYGDEVTAVITHTIERWDGREAARRIELHVGRDLQFIRINGTIVGGLVGVAHPRRERALIALIWGSGDASVEELRRERHNDVPVEDDSIKLGQFLKLADLVESGAQAKQVLAGGIVRVNGDVETRRGRQLERGDVVSLGANSARVGGERDWE